MYDEEGRWLCLATAVEGAGGIIKVRSKLFPIERVLRMARLFPLLGVSGSLR